MTTRTNNNVARAALEFREKLHRASRAVELCRDGESKARDLLHEAVLRRKQAQAELENLIRAEYEPLPLFDRMLTLEETLEAEADLDELEVTEPTHNGDTCPDPSSPSPTSTPLASLGLSARAHSALEAAGISTVEQLREHWRAKPLTDIEGIGVAAARKIVARLQ